MSAGRKSMQQEAIGWLQSSNLFLASISLPGRAHDVLVRAADSLQAEEFSRSHYPIWEIKIKPLVKEIITQEKQ